jgi:hypothetical protein
VEHFEATTFKLKSVFNRTLLLVNGSAGPGDGVHLSAVRDPREKRKGMCCSIDMLKGLSGNCRAAVSGGCAGGRCGPYHLHPAAAVWVDVREASIGWTAGIAAVSLGASHDGEKQSGE